MHRCSCLRWPVSPGIAARPMRHVTLLAALLASILAPQAARRARPPLRRRSGAAAPQLLAFRGFHFSGGGGFGRRRVGFGGYGRRGFSHTIAPCRAALAFVYFLHLFFTHGGVSIVLWLLVIGLIVHLLRRRVAAPGGTPDAVSTVERWADRSDRRMPHRRCRRRRCGSTAVNSAVEHGAQAACLSASANIPDRAAKKAADQACRAVGAGNSRQLTQAAIRGRARHACWRLSRSPARQRETRRRPRARQARAGREWPRRPKPFVARMETTHRD